MARPRGRGPIASVLVLLAGVLLALARQFDAGAPTRVDPPPAPPPVETRRSEPTAVPDRPVLEGVSDEETRAQVERVVEAMDRTGQPPPGVAQGGRRGGPKGVFDNREGRLPRRAPGYYVETDVWPKRPGRNRGTHRLVFGRGGEVYYTADHYRTFVTVRGPTR